MFSNYRPQRKVMFSQASVILSQHNKMYHNMRPPVDTDLPIPLDTDLLDRDFPSGQRSPHSSGQRPPWTGSPPELTSSSGHCSGRYASYCNAFLFVFFLLTGNLPRWVIILENNSPASRTTCHW